MQATLLQILVRLLLLMVLRMLLSSIIAFLVTGMSSKLIVICAIVIFCSPEVVADDEIHACLEFIKQFHIDVSFFHQLLCIRIWNDAITPRKIIFFFFYLVCGSEYFLFRKSCNHLQ